MLRPFEALVGQNRNIRLKPRLRMRTIVSSYRTINNQQSEISNKQIVSMGLLPLR